MSADWEAEVCGVEAEEPDLAVLERLERKGDKTDKDTGEVTLGKPLPTLLNVSIILREDERFVGRASFDEFKQQVHLDGEPLTDEAETGLTLQIAEIYGLNAKTTMVREALVHVAREAGFHRVREYLEGLEWDGTLRAETWLSTYLGVEDTPLHREYALRFLIGAVARVLDPGCKVDTTLTLAGPQGAGKSTTFSILAVRPEWFCDSALHFGNKDAYENLRGVWLYELAELDSLRRSRSSAIKAFLSARIDHYRPSYGRNKIEVPRQNVFVGSTNEEEFLKDTTGSRRFWPVSIVRCDRDALLRDRDQLWAEAVMHYRAGEPWWLSEDGERARVEASERFREVDAWEQPIIEWLKRQTGPFSVADLLDGAIKKETAHQARGDTMRAAGILAQLGYSKKQRRIGGRRAMYWWRWTAADEGGEP